METPSTPLQADDPTPPSSFFLILLEAAGTVADVPIGGQLVRMIVEAASQEHLVAYASLRAALWPDVALDEHLHELATSQAAQDGRAVAFVALTNDREVIGLTEAALRHDYVNGCETTPVFFLEGIYVKAKHRSAQVAHALCGAVEAWGVAAGCREFASDAEIANTASQAFHAALGFEATERVVFYRKLL